MLKLGPCSLANIISEIDISNISFSEVFVPFTSISILSQIKSGSAGWLWKLDAFGAHIFAICYFLMVTCGRWWEWWWWRWCWRFWRRRLVYSDMVAVTGDGDDSSKNDTLSCWIGRRINKLDIITTPAFSVFVFPNYCRFRVSVTEVLIYEDFGPSPDCLPRISSKK